MARVGEICNLRISDVDFTNQILSVRGKGNKQRFIPIDPDTMILLEEYLFDKILIDKKKDIPVFTNLNGNSIKPRTIQRDLQKLKLLAGFEENKKRITRFTWAFQPQYDTNLCEK